MDHNCDLLVKSFCRLNKLPGYVFRLLEVLDVLQVHHVDLTIHMACLLLLILHQFFRVSFDLRKYEFFYLLEALVDLLFVLFGEVLDDRLNLRLKTCFFIFVDHSHSKVFCRVHVS